LIVVDIAEEVALNSLKYTNKILNERPNEFKDVNLAIKWR
jgi:hypothetical protein